MCAILFTFTALSANATLFNRMGGAAAYDDVLDITWVTDASLSGVNDWFSQVVWAENLDYLDFDGWRLASMSVAAGLPTGTTTSVVNCTSATEEQCKDNELGYMYYYNLGGMLGDNFTGRQTVDGVGLMNIRPFYYSGTEFDDFNNWIFGFGDGFQGYGALVGGGYGWAVADGDVFVPEPSVPGVVLPLPAAVWLLLLPH